jgi:dTDP-4-dehydrorhamnose reductase
VASCFGLSTANVTRGSVEAARLPARRPTDMRMDCTRFEARFNVTLPTLESEIARMKDTYASEQ